jgi:intein-encoded DNA endonuclease-like protein
MKLTKFDLMQAQTVNPLDDIKIFEEQVCNAYKNQESIHNIAKTYRRATTTIKSILVKNDVKIRTKYEAQMTKKRPGQCQI